MNDHLTALYNYRVINHALSDKSLSFPDRFQAARQIVQWLQQGTNPQHIEEQYRVDGHWQPDEKLHTMALSQYNKSRAKQAKEKTVSLSDALRSLAQACKITANEKAVSFDHIRVLRLQMEQVDNLLIQTEQQLSTHDEQTAEV
jgi:hypothetical protein